MFCVRCQEDLRDCKCPDKEERVRAIDRHPNILMAHCEGCGEPYPLCKCKSIKGNGHDQG